jgi:hypothetical protein
VRLDENVSGKRFELRRWKDNNSTVMTGISLPDDFDFDKPHHIRAVVIGNTVDIYLDGNLAISYGSLGNPKGLAGYRTYGSKVSADNLQVWFFTDPPEELDAILSSSSTSVVLKPQEPEAGCSFYYTVSANSVSAPDLDSLIDDVAGTFLYSADAEISPLPSYVQVYKVETATGKIKGFGEAYAQLLEKAASPVANPAPGEFTGPHAVSLSTSTEGASIYYTTDGQTPTELTGTLYQAPISVSQDMTIRAVAIKEGLEPSDVSVLAYVIGKAQYVGSVATPEAEAVTHNSITLVPLEGYEYLCLPKGSAIPEYASWQDSSVFTGLSPLTEYDFHQRVKETQTTYASAVSSSSISTAPAPVEPTYSIAAGPAALTPSSQAYGYTPAKTAFSIVNTGNSTITDLTVAFDGTDFDVSSITVLASGSGLGVLSDFKEGDTAVIEIAPKAGLGKGTYSGNLSISSTLHPEAGKSLALSFTVTAASLSAFAIVAIPAEIYTGSAITPSISIPGLVLGVDYTAAYENNVEEGIATVVATGIGNYAGMLRASFKIAKADDGKVPDGNNGDEKDPEGNDDDGGKDPDGNDYDGSKEPDGNDGDGGKDPDENGDNGANDNIVPNMPALPIYIPSPPYYTAPSRTPTPAITPAPTAAPSPIPNYTVTTAATVTSLALELFKVNLFVGTGADSSGNPVFELERPLTRLESLAIVIRLLGLEEEALSSTVPNPFKDVPSWGDRIAAYAYSIGLTFGIDDEHTLFASDRLATPQEFTAFLLRILGYREATGDFEYSEALRKAMEVGLFKELELGGITEDEMFLRAEAVIAIVDVLRSSLKGSSTKLIDQLVSQGSIGKDSADALIAIVNQLHQPK